jgi:outer membrane immunogenic protein
MRHAARLFAITLAGALILMSGSAMAGGLYAPGPVSPMSWSGFYVGGNLGGAFDPNDLSIKDLSEEQDLTLRKSNDDEFIGGVHAGYNWQMQNYLIGIEGDANFANDLDVLGSIRGRLGLVYDRWLVYGTAGVAFLSTDEHFVVVSADDGPFGFKHSDDDTGFVGGGGVDYMIWPNVSAGVSALFYDFGTDKQRFVAGEDEPFILKDNEDFAVVQGRLSYFFNSGGY